MKKHKLVDKQYLSLKTVGDIVSLVRDHNMASLDPATLLVFKDKKSNFIVKIPKESQTNYMKWAKHYYKAAISPKMAYENYNLHKSFSAGRMQLMWKSLFLAVESGEI